MRINWVCFLCAMAVMSIGVSARRAAATSFTIDTAQSSLSIVVGAYDASEPPLFTPISSAQVPGSDVTGLNGSFEANTSGGLIEILSGAIGFENQSVDMSPLPGGALPGAAPANYGLTISVTFPSGQVLVAGPAAGRDVAANISMASTPVFGNSFSSDGALLALTAGMLDVNLTGLTTIVSGVDISGNSGLNTAGLGTFTDVGGVQTILIPVHVEALVPIEISPGNVLPFTAIFVGQIVATAVPEPSTLVLAGLGVAGLGLAFRRRRLR